MQITVSNSILSAVIDTKGAELKQLLKGNQNYIWEIDTQYWDKTSPVLFPIVGRLKEDKYTINNKEYSLLRHGFARNFNFEMVNHSENQVVFRLSENEETLKVYPFQFELEMKYILIENTLTIQYSVKNNSETSMPFSIGAHPAFALDTNLEAYALVFDQEDSLIRHKLKNDYFSGDTSEILLQDHQLHLSDELFEKDAIVLKSFQSKEMTLLKNQVPYLSFQLEGFPHLGIWKKANAPFLCIEPWQGFADHCDDSGEIFQKEGIIVLPPNEVFTTSFSITIL
ncbi:aldose 1-epimerase family protein [Flavobacterium luminosum]|uniref:Aldose 1-epimerase family protein n=1 Tax=Flavobacterium luminosum TaxID=2949086 RepID=A0ABT0TN77_9FLAO|nr:aldose 1-epimerase family protein [Flavobacterium sp. HXWNR70]MCL9808544.1 aldose 1-epimerase family protein [Flavobacterium sp. HXWNR70]